MSGSTGGRPGLRIAARGRRGMGLRAQDRKSMEQVHRVGPKGLLRNDSTR
jgi:hypothetical protein